MVDTDWRNEIINWITDEKLPTDNNKAITIARRSKGYVLVGDKLYKRGSHSGVLMKCIPREEGKGILDEIHSGVCGNHTTSRMLVGKAFRAGFYWPTALMDAKILIKQCKKCQFFGKQAKVLAHNLITILVIRMLRARHDRPLNKGSERIHLRAGRHRQIHKVDRVQAGNDAERRQSHRFYL